MDYFDSNFKDDQSNHDLPEDFGWDDMKGGIYEKMGDTSPSMLNKYWPLLLLLLVAGCGGLMTLKYLGQQDAKPVALEQNEVKKSVNDAEGERPLALEGEQPLTPKGETRLVPNGELPLAPKGEVNPASSQFSGKINPTLQGRGANQQALSRTQPLVTKGERPQTSEGEAPLTPKGETPLIPEGETPLTPKGEAPLTPKGEALLIPKGEALLIPEGEQPLAPKGEVNLSNKLSLTAFARLNSLNTPAIPSRDFSDDFAFVPQRQALKNRFKKYLSLSLAGAISNWTAGDPTNVNHDYLSGFPGYAISPAISLNIKPKQAIQLAYTYTNIEELLDYDGSHNIQVDKKDEVVKEVINSLTGEVISRERKDVKVDGVRSIRERKYNRFTLQSLSLGYRYGKNLNEKSAVSLYMGASYLFDLNSKGKRLNEDLDVIVFNDDSPLFRKNQIGLSFGFSYDYELGKRTTLFSQLIATKYVTNWEISGSNSATRPFIYGLQLGIRQRFLK